MMKEISFMNKYYVFRQQIYEFDILFVISNLDPVLHLVDINHCTETCDVSQEEVVRKTQSFERLKGEAEKCLSQSEKFRNEKIEFESAVYAKVCYVA